MVLEREYPTFCWTQSTWRGRAWSATYRRRDASAGRPGDLREHGRCRSRVPTGQTLASGPRSEPAAGRAGRPISQTVRSDAIEAAAGDLMQQIDAFRRQPAASNRVPEKELSPPGIVSHAATVGDRRTTTSSFPTIHWSSELNNREVVRAWENVLLLDGNDADAMTHLGVASRLSCNRWLWNYEGIPVPRKQAAAAQCIAGSQPGPRLRVQPARERAATYVFCLRPLIEVAPAPRQGDRPSMSFNISGVQGRSRPLPGGDCAGQARTGRRGHPACGIGSTLANAERTPTRC